MPLSSRMPDLTSLELLLAIAHRGSLSAAGRDIGLTQQAISARMASLEAQTECGCWCGPPAVLS
jgi:DNA-binding transcriptional LysR family regulator